MTAAIVWNGLPIWEVQAAVYDCDMSIFDIFNGTYALANDMTLLRTEDTTVKLPLHVKEGSSFGREHQGLGLSPCLVDGCRLRWNGCAL